MFIEVHGISYDYKKNTPYQTKALEDVSFSMAEGSFVGLIGHTGCGKSTLVQHLNGLLSPDQGYMVLDGVRYYAGGQKPDRDLRRKVGMVFQYPEDQLFEETIFDDVAFAPRNFKLGEKEVTDRVRQAMEDVGLDFDKDKDRSPFSLSGGQMRKVAIAGVLAARPRVLVLDEPTAGLDPRGREELLRQIDELRASRDITILLVSHSMDDIAAHAERVLVMNQGKIVLDDSPREVFAHHALLTQMGLDIPTVTKLMLALEKKGQKVDTQISSMAQALDEIMRLKKGGDHV